MSQELGMSQKLGPLQKEWIKALRSGGYKQCQQTLQQKGPNGESSYCCLGVAVEVLRLNAGYQPNLGKDGGLKGNALDSDQQPGVKDVLRLRSAVGDLDATVNLPYRRPAGGYDYMQAASLTSLNDRLGYDFKDIADFIEKNPGKVFLGSA